MLLKKTYPDTVSQDLKSMGIGSGSYNLDPIKEEIDRINFKENFSKIRRPMNTKIIGGGPLYPIPAAYEKTITDLDDSCLKHKVKFS